MIESKPYDVAILGAGISGLVAAAILSKDSSERVVVIDDYKSLGGNHLDFRIGPYTYDVGSLIFQDDSPLIEHFPELLESYVPIEPSWKRLTPQGRVNAYPISLKDDLIAAGPLEWFRIALSVIWARAAHRRIDNAYDFARYWIGARFLARSGLETYLKRFYGLSAELIDPHFAKSRMMWIQEYASISKYLRMPRFKQQASAPNQQLARPFEGFSRLYESAQRKLERKGVTFHLDAKLTGVRKESSGFLALGNMGEIRSKRIVSTLPLNAMLSLCQLPLAGNLRSVTLISLFYSFSGDRGFDSSILYNFSDRGSWKRLTVYSDFYGAAENREYFAVEVPAESENPDVALAAREFRNHTANNDLFKGDLNLEGSYLLRNAYPVYTHGASSVATDAIERLRAFGVESIGRQGRFDYQPTARDSTIKAERALSDFKV